MGLGKVRNDQQGWGSLDWSGGRAQYLLLDPNHKTTITYCTYHPSLGGLVLPPGVIHIIGVLNLIH